MSIASMTPVPDRLVGGGLRPAEPGRQGFMKQNMDLDFVNRTPGSRPFSTVAKNLGSVRFARVLGGASTFTRARRHLADGRDLVSLVVSGGGRFRLEGVRGNDTYAGLGGAVLDSRCESVLHCLEDSSAWTLVMDRTELEPMLCGMQGPLQHCIAPGHPALVLLDNYLRALFSLDCCGDRTLAATHIRDLALSAIGVTGDVQALVRERGVSAARLQAVLQRLAREAAEPDLDPVRFAGRIGMSPRYLHRLLEPTGRTFCQHLLAARLHRAAGMLRDPRMSHLKIGEIAALSGFSDISHFNRSFRRTYGDTPFGMRARAAAASGYA